MYRIVIVCLFAFFFSCAAEKVDIVKNTVEIEVGGVKVLDVDVLPFGVDDTVIWSSDNEEIAVVSHTGGHVCGVAVGTVKITAQSERDKSVTDTCTVLVRAKSE